MEGDDFYTDEDFSHQGTANISDADLIDVTLKVMGGSSAVYGQFPHQVFLRLPPPPGGEKWLGCGASIIHPLLLLTAAHCLYDGINLRRINVTAGELDWRRAEGPEKFPQVHSAIVHPKLNNSTWDNDIAILTLETPIEFDDSVQPIRIPGPNQSLPEVAYVSGWGGTASQTSSSPVLQYVEVPFNDSQTCRDLWMKVNKTVTENMVCAGDNRRDACPGDSGGPLTCTDKETGEDFLCGIVSYGGKCNFKRQRGGSYPGIYTDVRRYHAWIEKHMRIWRRYYWNLRHGEPLERLDGSKSCGEGNFQCETIGSCIPEDLRCDGEDDCAPWDNSDEKNASCPVIKCAENRFACANQRRCVHLTFLCDGDNDCGDNSDEAG